MSLSALARTPLEIWQESLSYLLLAQNIDESYKIRLLPPGVLYFDGGEGIVGDWRAYTLRRPRKLKRIEANLRLVCSSWRTFVERSILVDLEESDISVSAKAIDPLQMAYGRPRNVSPSHMNHVKKLRWYTPEWKAAQATDIFASCLRHACQLQSLTLVGNPIKYDELSPTPLDILIQFAPSTITLRRLCISLVPELSRLVQHSDTHHCTLELPNLTWLDLFSISNYALTLKLPNLDTLRMGDVVDQCPIEQWDLPSLRFLEVESMSTSTKIVQSRFARNAQFFSLHLPIESMLSSSHLDYLPDSVWAQSLSKMIEISHPDPPSFGVIPPEHPVLHIHVTSQIDVKRVAKMFSIPSSHVRTVHLHHFRSDGLGLLTLDHSVHVLRELLGLSGLNVVVEGVQRPYRPSRTQRPPSYAMEREEVNGRNWRLHTYGGVHLRDYDTRFPVSESELEPTSGPASTSGSGFGPGFSSESEEIFDWMYSPTSEDNDNASGNEDHNVSTEEDGPEDDRDSLSSDEHAVFPETGDTGEAGELDTIGELEEPATGEPVKPTNLLYSNKKNCVAG
jgi:hypothetical protein